jgi:hypothetical protein
MVPLFEGQLAHEMHGVRMTCIKRQRLLATNLRVEVATGLQKAVTSLIKGCDAVIAGHCRPGCLGRMAFARVHLRIPGRLANQLPGDLGR